MAELEDAVSSKRKASPEPTEEDAAGKRIRLETEDDNALPNNGIGAELKDNQNGATPGQKEQNESYTERSPETAPRPEPEPARRDSLEARRPSATGGPPVRRNITLEEKKRGQRLFGGLVSALSRPASGAQQKKRLEIERRQQEKAQQRRAEDEKRRIERLERLKRTREIEQIKLEEQVMKTRHSTMLARARSLQTRSEPKLYYLPWEPTKEQEDIINDQIRAAEEMIDRERRNFKERRERRFKELGVTPPPRSPTPSPREEKPEPGPAPEPEAESRPDQATAGEPKSPPQVTNPDAAAPTPSKSRSNHHERDHDENGDEVMQDEEDIVIY
ncbi:hypothetical protein VTI74DRAFT_9767 [Chaetomium olivicolor]